MKLGGRDRGCMGGQNNAKGVRGCGGIDGAGREHSEVERSCEGDTEDTWWWNEARGDSGCRQHMRWSRTKLRVHDRGCAAVDQSQGDSGCRQRARWGGTKPKVGGRGCVAVEQSQGDSACRQCMRWGGTKPREAMGAGRECHGTERSWG